ncbi:MAG: hypothetical protein DSZ10_04050 [Sulfurovum sp.]|nr:MAG: hypothetical protein DSZ10_04050 [Sulfurovum sp.]
MTILTQYSHEKQWHPTQQRDILRIIKEEMPDIDAEGIWVYIREQIGKGKVVTLGECRFRIKDEQYCHS